MTSYYGLFLSLLVLFSLAGCQEEEVSDKGCLTGIRKGESERVLIRCCTYQEYAAGSNVAAGGTASWANYTEHKWEAVADCQDCY